jgi:hypothetical protein
MGAGGLELLSVVLPPAVQAGEGRGLCSKGALARGAGGGYCTVHRENINRMSREILK